MQFVAARITRYVAARLAVVSLAVVSLAVAVGAVGVRPLAAQTFVGTGCAADGSACATAVATPFTAGGITSYNWNASVTFNRVGALRVLAGAISSPTAGIPGGGTDLNAVFCCAAPGTTLTNIYAGLTTGPLMVGATYLLPIGAMTLPAGDPRSAADLAAQLSALGFGSASNAYPAYGDVGLHSALGGIALTATPEPATLGLVAGGLLALAAAARRRRPI